MMISLGGRLVDSRRPVIRCGRVVVGRRWRCPPQVTEPPCVDRLAVLFSDGSLSVRLVITGLANVSLVMQITVYPLIPISLHCVCRVV